MKTKGILLLSILFTLVHQVGTSQTESGTISFSDLRKKFSNHSSDFLEFAKSVSGSDKTAATGIGHIASEVSSGCEMLDEECLIVKIISNEKDKRAVQEIVLLRTKMTSEAVDVSLKTINGMLPLIKNTAVVVQANKMKEDLRALKETLRTLTGWLSKGEANVEKK